MSDYLIQISTGHNFEASKEKNIYGAAKCYTNQLNMMKPGDRLWFVKKGGQLVYVAIFVSFCPRMLGPHLFVNTNEEMGWTKADGFDPNVWIYEIHYKDRRDIRIGKLHLAMNIGRRAIIPYKEKHTEEDICAEYKAIQKWLK